MCSFYLLVVMGALIGPALSLADFEEDMDWESFEAALSADGEDPALSLLQNSASVFKPLAASTNKNVPESSLNIAQRSEEMPEHSGDIHPDVFDEMLKSDEVMPEAVSFVQTDAHFEQKVVAGRMAVATEADGANVVMQDRKGQAQDGMMHMSIGADGRLQLQDEMSFLQEVSQRSATTHASGKNMKLAEKAHVVEQKTATLASSLQDDGAVMPLAQKNATLISRPSNQEPVLQVESLEPRGTTGAISFDEFVQLMTSEEKVPQGMSLLQTEAHIERNEVHKLNVKSPEPRGTTDGISFDEFVQLMTSEDMAPQGVSLVQREASVERRALAIGAAGSAGVGPQRLKMAKDGMMKFSITADGHFTRAV